MATPRVLQTYNHAKFGVLRIYDIEGKPYVRGGEICKGLGYPSAGNMFTVFDPTEKKRLSYSMSNYFVALDAAARYSVGRAHRTGSPTIEKFSLWLNAIEKDITTDMSEKGMEQMEDMTNANPETKETDMITTPKVTTESKWEKDMGGSFKMGADGMTIFEDEQFGKLRARMVDGKPWFALVDVVKCVGLTSPYVFVRRVEDGQMQTVEYEKKGRNQTIRLISLDGLKKVLPTIRNKDLKDFEGWVDGFVLAVLNGTMDASQNTDVGETHADEVNESSDVMEGDTAVQLQVFRNEQFGEIRVQEIDGEPWFVAADVCEALEIKNSRDALERLDGDEKGVALTDTPGGKQNMAIVNEPGLYTLVLGSRKPEAKAFKRWVTHDVIPTIRKHGIYATPQTVEKFLNDPDTLILVLQEMKRERAARIAAESRIEADTPYTQLGRNISESTGDILIREMAKLLHQSGVDIGEKRLFTKLRTDGYLISSKSRDYNLPTQRSMNMGLMHIKESSYKDEFGNINNYRSPRITGKGQVYFMNLYGGKRIEGIQ